MYFIKSRTWIRVKLNSDPLSKVSSLSRANGKNVVGRGDSSKDRQPGSPTKISRRQNRWILHGYIMVKKNQDK